MLFRGGEMVDKVCNLMPIDEVNSRRTREEHSEDSRRGGIASGKSRRELKAFKECINELLGQDGGEYDGEIVSKRYIIATRAVKYLIEDEDLDARSFAKMFEVVRDTIGEKPIDRFQIAEINQKDIDEVEAMVLGTEEEPAYFPQIASE